MGRSASATKPTSPAASTGPTIADAVSAWTKSFYVQQRQACRVWVKRQLRCRECGAEARLLDDVCGSCGANSPVRVPQMVPVAAGAIALLVVFAVWFCL
jgi:hypothetical protein